MKIIQFNVRSYWGIRNAIRNYINDEKPDVLLLNSTGVTNGGTIKHPGYTSRQSPDGQHQGVAILVRTSNKHEYLTGVFLNHSFLAVKVHTTLGPIIVATAYARPNSHIPMHDFNTLYRYNNYPIFFAGDLNAHHTQFQHGHIDNHGRELMAIFNTKRLHYIGPDFETFYGPNGRGRPDLVFGNRAALPYHTHCRPGPITGSDHIPVVITITTNPIQVPEKMHYDYARADWEGFVSGLNEARLDVLCDVQGKNPGQIDYYWLSVLHNIKWQMDISIPQTTFRLRCDFMPSVRTRRLEICYRNLFSMNLNRIPQVQWNLNILRRHILDSYKRDRAEHWAALVRKVQTRRTTDPAAFWRDIRRLKGSDYKPFDHLIKRGRKVSDPNEANDIMRTHWYNVFKPHNPHPSVVGHVNDINNWINDNQEVISPLPTVDLSLLDGQNSFTAPITLAEVKTDITHVKKRAPGLTGMTREVIRKLPNSVLRAVTALFNASLALGYFPQALKSAVVIFILKPGKDPTDPASYRPISLLEILAKILEGILNARLIMHLEDNDLLPTMQFGFRRNRSTHDVTNIMTTYLVNNWDRKLKTVIVTKDVEKAFDTVWHRGLKYKLANNFNLPPLAIKILCSFLDNRSCFIRFMGVISNPIHPRAGDPQGSKLSPTLYIMYVADMPRPLPRHHAITLMYADDCTHMTRAHAIDMAILRMNLELDSASRWERKWRIKTNPEKTKVLINYPTPLRGKVIGPVYINQTDWPRRRLTVESCITVLGVKFDKRLRFHKNAADRLGKARRALRLIKRFGSASIPTKRHLYQALVKPHLTYGSLPLLLAAKTRRKALQTTQNCALRWMHNTRWSDFTTNRTLHEITRNIPALNLVWSRQTGRQLERLQAWHPDWIRNLQRLARTGHWRRLGIARNILEIDWAQDDPEF